MIASRKWGFTALDRTDYVLWKKEGRIELDGSNAKVRPFSLPLFASFASRGAVWGMCGGPVPLEEGGPGRAGRQQRQGARAAVREEGAGGSLGS